MIEQPLPIEALPPGDTLGETLEMLPMTQIELAKRTGINKKTINRIVAGIEPITEETALALENALKIPAHFWLNMERQYRAGLARKKEEEKIVEFADWARRFPYPAMVNNGLVPPAKSAEEKATHLLPYFAVRNPDQWEETYREEHLALSYRKSPKVSNKVCMRSAWLRAGEIEAAKVETAEFDLETFKDNLQVARGLTLSTPGEFLPKLQNLCAEAGVVYVLVREFPGLGISGVMRWHRNRPVIQQTLRFKTNDNFWFTFFHEAKHVLQKRKKRIFLEGKEVEQIDPEREAEADAFARNMLIPSGEWTAFVRENPKPTVSSIKKFAVHCGIHPGIVVGRLFREKRLHYSHSAQNLQAKFSWK